MNQIVRIVLVSLLIILGAIAFSLKNYQQVTDLKGAYTQVPVRIVQHAMGKTQIPVHPQRIVILHGYLWSDAIAVGVKPVGAPLQWADKSQIDFQQSQGVVDVGFLPTNIEKVLALKPDLILGTDVVHKDIYPLLSHIAPTVLIDFNAAKDWKGLLMQTAEVLGKTEAAQSFMTQYNTRVTEFKTTALQRLINTQVSVIGLGDGEICRLFLREKGSFLGGIFEEVGLLNTVSQEALNTLPTRLKGIGTFHYYISWEHLPEVDGDVIFVTSSGPSVSEKYPTATFKRLQSMPLWFKLKAVEQGKAYRVGFHWVGNTPFAANQVLDDLFKYLL
ncbi:MAG: iron-siderophore ABC transporter substrate-binding protein [Nostoc sp.]|uniref:iron-siderophore ABC transporter substrate-binding protein n=1 Tax=Nostoc sp. TaxID=1180 RepID=UPI002FFAA31F